MKIQSINKISITRLSQFIFCLIVIIMAVFLFYINLEMPLSGEDYTMQPWGYNSAPFTFLGKIGAIWHIVYYSAILWNPRIGEALTTITAAFPKLVFDVINTLLFIWLNLVLFVVGFGRFPDWKKPSDGFTVFSIFFLIISLCPLFGQIFIWKAGTCNHTWGLIVLFSFILPFRINYYRRIHLRRFIILLLFIILGFFAGLSVENASVVVLGFLILYFIIYSIQKKIDMNFIFPLISYAVGVFLLLFSSGTTIRRNYYASQGYDANFHGIATYINRFFRIGTDFIKISWPLLVVFFACLIIYYILKQQDRSLIKNTILNDELRKLSLPEIIILFVLSSLSVLVLISVSYQSDQRRGFEFFWLILISLSAYILTEIWIRIPSNYWRLVVMIFALILLIPQMLNMGMVFTQFHAENNIRMEIIYNALENGERKITLPAITIKDSRIVETREILTDLGIRIAGYYGFDLVEIMK